MKMAELSLNTLPHTERGRSSWQRSPFWAETRGASMPEDNSSYPPIADYALISDCRAVALVSGEGSIDWCCMPRIDHGSCFGRLLDWQKGGYCSIAPARDREETTLFRRYVEGTLVLETTFRSNGGEARLFDFFVVDVANGQEPQCRLLRVIEGTRGHMDLRLRLSPRFDYGEVEPWLRHHGMHIYSATGGDDALVISGDLGLNMVSRHDLETTFSVRAGERARISIAFVPPHELEKVTPQSAEPAELDRNLDDTIRWWREWTSQVQLQGLAGVKAVRSSSEFNFSMITVIFEDGVDFYFARQRVSERLAQSSSYLPPGVTPYMAPDATALGQIYWYTLEPDPTSPAGAGFRIHLASVDAAGAIREDRVLEFDRSRDDEFAPIWLPDGQHLLFQRLEGTTHTLAVAPVVPEVGSARDLGIDATGFIATNVSPDGRTAILRLPQADGSARQVLLDLTTLESTAIDPGGDDLVWQRLAP